MDLQEIRNQLREQSAAQCATASCSKRATIPFLGEKPLRADTSAKAHSATKGLFGHIQANNFKSLILLVVFLMLSMLVQATVNSITLPAHSQFAARINIIFAESLRDDVLAKQAADPRLQIPKVEGTGLSARFNYVVERYKAGNSSEALKSPLAWFLVAGCLIYILQGLVISSLFVRRQANATSVTETSNPRLFKIVSNLAAARGLPMPRLEIIAADGRNAYASGMHPSRSAIGVTQGLLESLNGRELKAVLAHELAHIEGRDNRLMTIAKLCHEAVTDFIRQLKTASGKAQLLLLLIPAAYIVPMIDISLFVAVIATGFIVWSISSATKNLISQKREFHADAMAIEITKDPAALISALRKVSINDRVDNISPNLQAMMISNLSGTQAATHPSIGARIHAIEATTTVNNVDIAAVEAIPAPGRKLNSMANRTAGPRMFGAAQANTVAQCNNAQPLIENEKLDGAYRFFTKAGASTRNLSTLLTIAVAVFTMAPIVFIPAMIAAGVVSGITGISIKLLVPVAGIATLWFLVPRIKRRLGG